MLTYEDPSRGLDVPEPLAAVITDAMNLVSLVSLALSEARADEIGPGYRTIQRMRLRLASASEHLDRYLTEPDDAKAC
jgi:hypothetical protein